MNITFASAHKEKISTVIVNQIRTAIMQGKLRPNEALPPENELRAQLGVSKHTLREALRALEGMGLITIRRGAGGGPVVSEITWETAREHFANFLYFQNFSFNNLSEVRKIIEPYLARRAAENFPPDALDELQSVHEQCAEIIRRNEPLYGAEAEILFHVLLGKYTNNPVLWVVLDFVNNMLAESKKQMHLGEDFSRKVQAAHQKIIDAIRLKDPDAAAKYMYQHICEVEKDMELVSK